MILIRQNNSCLTKKKSPSLYGQDSPGKKAFTFIAFTSVTAAAITAIFAGVFAVGNGAISSGRGLGFVPGGPFILNCESACHDIPPECNPSNVLVYSARKDLLDSNAVRGMALLSIALALIIADRVFGKVKKSDGPNNDGHVSSTPFNRLGINIKARISLYSGLISGYCFEETIRETIGHASHADELYSGKAHQHGLNSLSLLHVIFIFTAHIGNGVKKVSGLTF